MADYRITIVFDYTAEGEIEIDDDELHDAIVDSFDNVDLEGSYEAIVYDEDGDETDDRVTVTFNCDNLRECEVLKLDS